MGVWKTRQHTDPEGSHGERKITEPQEIKIKGRKRTRWEKPGCFKGRSETSISYTRWCCLFPTRRVLLVAEKTEEERNEYYTIVTSSIPDVVVVGSMAD